MSKPILCLDFDGVIHSYTSGWKGADQIPDPPVDGAFEFIEKALEHFRVVIFSSRTHQPNGILAMQAWLLEHTARVGKEHIVPEIEWPVDKPAAFLTLDDRALLFTGQFPDPRILRNFKPWNKP
jgi:hypothetical protein